MMPYCIERDVLTPSWLFARGILWRSDKSLSFYYDSTKIQCSDFMVRYWKIRAGTGGYLWDVWKREKIITIGWNVGEILDLKWDEVRDLIEDNYDDPAGRVATMLQQFVGTYEGGAMNEGDIAIVLGSGTVLDIAKIGEYMYHEEALPESRTHAYWRDVDYYNLGPVRIRDLPDKFQQGAGQTSLHLVPTINEYYIDEDTLNELISSIEELESIDTEESLADLSEDSVQQYIYRNYTDIDPSLIKIEREHSTRVGDADFYCEDEKKNIVVIEVKTGTAKDNVVGQILGYMNSIRENETRDVRGILVAESFTERVKIAVKSDDITLITFKTKLDFSKIN